MSADRLHSRARSFVSGSAALGALVVLVIGVPLGLAVAVGWPLPHHVPTVAGLRTALTTRGIPSQTLLDGLACVAWLAWASVALSIGEEVVAAVRGRVARHIPVASSFQPVASRLVVAVLFAMLAFSRPQPAAPPPVRAPLALQLRPETATLTAAVVGAPPQPPPAQSTARVNTSTNADTSVTYTVVRHDTLWSIAQNQLGDPLKWRELFALNEGRPQPDGRTLTDPSWIYPGWVLILPAEAPVATQPPPPQPSPTVPATTSTVPPTNPAPTAGRAPTEAPNSPVPDKAAARAAARPIVLPSGSVIAPSFAAGVLAAVTAGRLRRRRRYRPSDPRPGRDLRRASLGPALRDLRQATAEADFLDQSSHGVDGPAWFRGTETVRLPPPHTHAAKPGVLDIGTRGDEMVLLDLASVNTIAVGGPGADDVVRAWCAALLTGASPVGAEVLTTAHVASSLFPGLHRTTTVRTVETSEALLGAVEAEIIGRSRQMSDGDLPASYREIHPEDPLPILLVLAGLTSEAMADRWRSVRDASGPLDVVVLSPADHRAAAAKFIIDRDRTVTSVVPDHLADRLLGATLYGLDEREAVELINTVTTTYHGEQIIHAVDAPDVTRIPGEAQEEEAEWPEEMTTASPDTAKSIEVRLLGPYRITVQGQEITKGLRSVGKELLAWYLLRPEGAGAEAAVDALWPDTPPELVAKRFWRGLGDLRTHLRHDGSTPKPDVLIRSGDHYRPQVDELTCDLWHFLQSLVQSSRAANESEVRAALRAAIDSYHGDFASDADYLWVEPVREDLHRRALDAHVRLAELEEACGRDGAALGVLERAAELDHYAEEIFRRLMALQERMGRTDSVVATWRQLQRNLAELELDPEPATVRLYGELSRAHDLEDAAVTARS